jgi:proton glutamate symport protein
MSLTSRVLLALVLGLAFGIALATVLPVEWRVIASWVEPVGSIWTRALQMTVLPLVVTLLFTGVLSGGRGSDRSASAAWSSSRCCCSSWRAGR